MRMAILASLTAAASVISMLAFSQPVSANTACMQQLAAAGKQIGYATDLSAAEVDVIGPSSASLNPLWARMESCLNSAYTNQRTGKATGSGPYNYRQWFNQKNSAYEWCASQVPEVGILGGSGPQSKDYAIWVRCGTNSATLPNGMF